MIIIVVIAVTFAGYAAVLLTVGTTWAWLTMVFFGAWLGCISVLAARYLEVLHWLEGGMDDK